jgi:hypothetical protein
MTLLADFSSFLGSIWFAGLCAVCGYILGHVFPITKFKKD